MSQIRLAARSARSVMLCLPPGRARFHLDPGRAWRLSRDGQSLREAVSDTVCVTLHGLEPATTYHFEAEGAAPLVFETGPCSGMFSIADYGARPDLPDSAAEAAANAAAVQRLIDDLPAGATVFVPPGRWLCAPVRLKSAMTLQLAEGAVLAAPSSRDGWPILPAHDATGRMLGSWEGLPAACFAAPLHAIGAENLVIAGPGMLDGGGDRGDWWSWPKETREGARRPRGLHLVDCRDVTLLGFGIRNAPSWTIHPQGCRDLTAAGLHIMAPHDSPNTDGFDPEMCERVVMEGIRFSVGDDCIAIKAGKRGPAGEAAHLAPTRDVTIRHCLMERGHGGVVIGSEMSGDVTGIRVEACEMAGTDRGLRLKTRRGRGGRIDDVEVRNLLLDGVETAFSANAFYFCDPDGHAPWVQDRAPATAGETTPQIGRIQVSDVEIRNLAHAVGVFLGLPEAPIGPIRLERITVHSLDPAAQPAAPVMADHVRRMRHEGVLAEHADIICDPQLVCDAAISLIPDPQTETP